MFYIFKIFKHISTSLFVSLISIIKNNKKRKQSWFADSNFFLNSINCYETINLIKSNWKFNKSFPEKSLNDIQFLCEF